MDINKQLSTTFNELIDVFGEGELSDRLQVSTQTLNALANNSQFLDFIQILKVTEKCGFHMGLLGNKLVDTNCIIRRLKGESEIIQPQYLDFANTKRLVITSILKLLNQTDLNNTLSYFQISPDFFDPINGDKHISAKLTYDILDYLGTIRDFSVYSEIGMQIHKSYIGTPFGNSFAHLSAKQSYEMVFEEVFKHLEKSHAYRLVKLTDKECVIQKYLKEETAFNVILEDYSTNQNCQYIAGLATTLPLLSKEKVFYDITETKCIFEGDYCCEWSMDLTTPMRLRPQLSVVQ